MRANAAAAIRPVVSEWAMRPMTPPTAREPPTRARSKPVMAPRASSAITQTTPMMSNNQFVKLLKAGNSFAYVPRTITSPQTGFNERDSRDEEVQRLRRGRDFLPAERFFGDFLL